jgi:putative restriction endonuclease
LREFGPPRKVIHPEYPFWRLERDGLWDVRWPPPLQTREPRRVDPSHRQLVKEGVAAGFPEGIQQALEGNLSLIQAAAEMILAKHFPDTLHEEILTELGFSASGDREWTTRVRRDPHFRDRILLAYGHQCAICGFDLRMDGAPVGLDAAHIRWKQVGGPDEESNGLALCTLHHRLFDRGSFTVTDDRRTLVSLRVMGGSLKPVLLAFHGKEIRPPQEDAMAPAAEHLGWHRREVYRQPSRSFPD